MKNFDWTYKNESGVSTSEEIKKSGKVIGWKITHKGFSRDFLIGEPIPEWAWLLVPGNEILPEMWEKYASENPEHREYALQFGHGSKTLPNDERSAQLLMIVACDDLEDDKTLDSIKPV